MEGHKDHITAVAFRPDGKMVVTGDNRGGLILWDLNEKNLRKCACRIAGRPITEAERDQFLPLLGEIIPCSEFVGLKRHNNM